MQEVDALDMEVKRLKEVKAMHKEFRRYACLPIGVMSKPCVCCRGWTRKKHLCTHKFCDKPCRKQEQELAQQQSQQHVGGSHGGAGYHGADK